MLQRQYILQITKITHHNNAEITSLVKMSNMQQQIIAAGTLTMGGSAGELSEELVT